MLGFYALKRGVVMHLAELVRLSFSDVKRFFQVVGTEPPSHVLAYVSIIYIWYALVSTPFFILNRFVLGFSSIPLNEYAALLPLSFALVFVFWLFSIFIWSAIVHAFVSMWGGSGRFISTLRCISYGFTPLFVLSPFLFYALLLAPWLSVLILDLYVSTLYVIIRGISLTHQVSFGVAFTSYIIPFLAVCAWALYTLWRHFG